MTKSLPISTMAHLSLHLQESVRGSATGFQMQALTILPFKTISNLPVRSVPGVWNSSLSNYGAQLGASPPGADWSTYGFGTKEFKEIFLAALRAHKDAGLQMDFPLGPNQGQGVPAEPDDEGLQWDLVGLSTNIFYEPTFTIQGTILRCCSEEWSLRRNHPRMGLRRASRAGLSSGHLVSKL